MKVTNKNAIILKDKCKRIMNEIRELDALSKTLIICETDDERHFNKFLSKASGQKIAIMTIKLGAEPMNNKRKER